MELVASISLNYRWRLMAVGMMFLLFGVWFSYDGAVGYPKHNQKVGKFKELSQDQNEPKVWQAYAQEQGWSDEDPGSEKSETDILTQFLIGAACAPVGGFFMVVWFSSRKRWIRSDGQTLTTSWGSEVSFDAIRSVDSRRWRKKGIAVVQYQDGQGEGRVVLDDWKYDRKPTVEIFRQVVVHLKQDPEQIDQAEETDGAAPA